MGQKNSFSRGFDKILHMLLVSNLVCSSGLASLSNESDFFTMRLISGKSKGKLSHYKGQGSKSGKSKVCFANWPMGTWFLIACCMWFFLQEQVSIIVETDPEVLRDKPVQLAVEGRFCDSAISVREAALELVGRHIASHPDVGSQVNHCTHPCNSFVKALLAVISISHYILLFSTLRRLQRELKTLELVSENELLKSSGTCALQMLISLNSLVLALRSLLALVMMSLVFR